ncbi:GerMN domain-containing protein [Aestuariimicrobium sp. T2.26MG-19.2B]|uniref:GerMN domain-containing protein n=1 Tax=Aestuariimicrobium sp. T2.26MG-19.2B TaxID=3040679 RepID=UPI002477847B|nr:GerMN domain-containing protein [Aestuariimicrobium sp. T2.26MG-19.2B]CAI9410887.1 Lipoprotein LpqB [Aestuariimicrobium sp. T2.26MG-19.2B]
MIRRRDLFALVPVALAASGCATIATSGPVTRISQTPLEQNSQGVDIAPLPPSRGGNTEVILAGFLTAMATPTPGYQVARQYLTEGAAKSWKPDSGAVIYDPQDHPPITTDKSAVITAPLVGQVDGQGRFVPGQGTLQHDFGMQRVGGQWRIGNPPEGLLLAHTLFTRYYSPITIWFLSADSSMLAPQLVHVPDTAANPSRALDALLAGPSTWLGQAVGTALPAEAKGSTTVSIDSDGLALVNLSTQLNVLSEGARTRAAAQIVTTLTEFDQVQAVRLQAGGQVWQIPRASDPTRIRRSDFDSYQPVEQRAASDLVVVRDQVVGRIVEGGSPEFTPISGAFGGRSWGGVPGNVDVGPDLGTVVVVNVARTEVWTTQFGSDQATRRVTATQLCRPQVMLDGTVWSIGTIEGQPTLLRMTLDGQVHRFLVKDLPVGTVSAFRISPDRTTMALIVESGKTRVLGLVRLRGTETITVDGWLEMPVTTTSGRLENPRDVGWAEPATLVVLSPTAQDSRTSVWSVSADGALVEALGPSASDIEPVSLSATPRRQGVTAVIRGNDNRVWRFEDRFRWRLVVGGVTSAVLPG